jgi:hypothetical protein
MKHYIIGFISAALIASVALNIAQYRGVLSSPQMVHLQPSEADQLASILN